MRRDPVVCIFNDKIKKKLNKIDFRLIACRFNILFFLIRKVERASFFLTKIKYKENKICFMFWQAGKKKKKYEKSVVEN